MNILVAEDEKAMGDSICEVLGVLRKKFPTARIVLAATFEEARKTVREIPHPDVTLLDLTFPDSGWRNTIDNLNDFEVHSRVIIITGKTEEEVRSYMHRPEIEILHKHPGFFDSLIGAVARAFSRTKGDEERIARNMELLRELIPIDGPKR